MLKKSLQNWLTERLLVLLFSRFWPYDGFTPILKAMTYSKNLMTLLFPLMDLVSKQKGQPACVFLQHLH